MGVKAFFAQTPHTILTLLLFPTTLSTRELRDLACSLSGRREEIPTLSGFPNFSDGPSKLKDPFGVLPTFNSF